MECGYIINGPIIGPNKWYQLMDAAKSNDIVTAKLILEFDSSYINSVDDNGWNPLMIAAFYGNYDIVHILLEYGASINLANYKGWTPLLLACIRQYICVVKLFLDNRCFVAQSGNSDDEWNALKFVLLNGHADVIQLIINHEDGAGGFPLFNASEAGRVDFVELLIDKGAFIDQYQKNYELMTPLSIASKKGHIDVVKVLIKRGANVKSSIALCYASAEGHVDIVELLIDNGAYIDGDFRGSTLITASRKEQVDVVKFLLKKGARINVSHCLMASYDYREMTPLMIACEKKNMVLVKLLLYYGVLLPNCSWSNLDTSPAILNILANPGKTKDQVAAMIAFKTIEKNLGFSEGYTFKQVTARSGNRVTVIDLPNVIIKHIESFISYKPL